MYIMVMVGRYIDISPYGYGTGILERLAASASASASAIIFIYFIPVV